MPLFKGFKFSFNLSSGNAVQKELTENNDSPVYVKGAYKVIGEQFYGTGSYGESPKKLTPSMVKLPPAFQPDPTDPDVIKSAKSTGDITNTINLQKIPPNLRKSTPEVSSDPRCESKNNRPSTDLQNTNSTDTKNNKKGQNKIDKKRLAEQKKQEKIQAQQKAKEESLRKQREKTQLKEQAKQEKIKIQKEKADAAKKKKKVSQKPRTNPLAQGPNAPLPYSTNTLQSSISKSSGPPAYEENPIAIESRNESSSSSELTQNVNDGTGNTSFGAPIDLDNTWDLVAQHRAQVTRAPKGGVANKVSIRLQETSESEPNPTTGRKSLYV